MEPAFIHEITKLDLDKPIMDVFGSMLNEHKCTAIQALHAEAHFGVVGLKENEKTWYPIGPLSATTQKKKQMMQFKMQYLLVPRRGSATTTQYQTHYRFDSQNPPVIIIKAKAVPPEKPGKATSPRKSDAEDASLSPSKKQRTMNPAATGFTPASGLGRLNLLG